MGEKLLKISDQLTRIDINKFLNELTEAVKYLAIYETKVRDCRTEDGLFLPAMQRIEALSSLKIEGTQTTMNDVIADLVIPDEKNLDLLEIKNHQIALVNGAKAIKFEGFTDEIIKMIHKTLLTNVRKKNAGVSLGEYKTENNFIVNSVGTKVFIPPEFTETEEYMNDLIDFMNDTDYKGIHPLIRAAVMHAQFESIHPFGDGNGRVGRMLITLYLYYHKIVELPLFYISEALQQDKMLYYRKLTESREGDYNEWIKYFLSKCVDQAKMHIKYIDSINSLYIQTDDKVSKIIKGCTKEITKALFHYPQINVKTLSSELGISTQQANRYLKALVNEKILFPDDKKRNTSYFFGNLIDLII
ncbi:Fic family protein [Massilimicrobiota sp. SW1139]|uniref:Fic family protein n=1 Tax=Massilimicrobiota sp. SW1139 TaxID=2530043 RepID=UPI001439E7BD|nr:Fic family protein [Massilimicrobiota sp. SW1139]NJE44658.1 Fic family protein [Massilimicrobiota sp. SW1139]